MAISTVHPGPVIFLGALAFIDFEVPENVRFTPTQNVVIHKFIGGARHLDVLGQDDDTIKWSGTFLGPDASDRAHLLDQYVVGGEPQFLTWGTFGYEVVVKQVTFDYRGPFLIDYAIECYVVSDGLDEGQANGGAQAPNATNPQAPLDAAGNVPL
jgi:hypothetical protein